MDFELTHKRLTLALGIAVAIAIGVLVVLSRSEASISYYQLPSVELPTVKTVIQAAIATIRTIVH